MNNVTKCHIFELQTKLIETLFDLDKNLDVEVHNNRCLYIKSSDVKSFDYVVRLVEYNEELENCAFTVGTSKSLPPMLASNHTNTKSLTHLCELIMQWLTVQKTAEGVQAKIKSSASALQ